jgi:hypothetical protein
MQASHILLMTWSHLECRPRSPATKSPQRIVIEHFITIVRASHVLPEDISTANDDGSQSAIANSLIPEGYQDALYLWMNLRLPYCLALRITQPA